MTFSKNNEKDVTLGFAEFGDYDKGRHVDCHYVERHRAMNYNCKKVCITGLGHSFNVCTCLSIFLPPGRLRLPSCLQVVHLSRHLSNISEQAFTKRYSAFLNGHELKCTK
jgi:hypothetical protein